MGRGFESLLDHQRNKRIVRFGLSAFVEFIGVFDMDLNSLIPVVQALSPTTPIVTVLAKGIFATIFCRRNTETVEFEKLKVAKLGNIAQTLLDNKAITYTEFYKASNFEQIAVLADKFISNKISEDIICKFDFDWFIKFYEAVGTVSDEDMQEIWAKLLAGEITSPKSISYKTIEILKNLSSKEARLLENLLNKSILINNNCFIPRDDDYLKYNNIRYEDLLLLEDYGLMKIPQGLTMSIRILEGDTVNLCMSNQYTLQLKNIGAEEQTLMIEHYPFTIFAYQLLLIIGSFTTDKSLCSFKDVLQKNYNELEIKIVPTITVEIK